MKNLEIFEVHEMNTKEMKNYNGGIILAINALYVFGLYSAFMKGYEDGRSA